MEDKNCALLFEYLRRILYEPSAPAPDLSTLDEPFQKLGQGVRYLDTAVREMREYSAALSTGNLSDHYPSRDNPLCENLKNIHANLNHLTWQAKQVAKGDYSQTVSYLGEFSEAFNTMTAQLKERENALKQEAQHEKEYADALEQEAYTDPLTGIGNRAFFNQKFEKLLKTDSEFVFCFCDLDHLKDTNDTFGHTAGDDYLCRFVAAVQPHLRASDSFARVGGDEFCILLKNCPLPLARRELTEIQQEFRRTSPAQFAQDFSFGLVHLPKGHGQTDPAALLRQADAAMYEQKKQHHAH